MLVQSTLYQLPQSPSLRLIRFLLLPVCLYFIWTCLDIFLEPAQGMIPANIAIQFARAGSCLRVIEMATAAEQCRWIGLRQAYNPEQENEGERRIQPIGIGEAIRAGFANLGTQYLQLIAEACRRSLTFSTIRRGIGWSWGIKGEEIPPTFSRASPGPELMAYFLRIHVATLVALSMTVTFRQAGSAAAFFSSLLHVKRSLLFDYVSESVNILATGCTIASSIEAPYASLTFLVWLSNTIGRAVLPVSLAPAPFDTRAWPRLMHSPHRATSLHEFWGRRWHALPRRNNVHIGSKPLCALFRAIGLGRGAQTLAGAFGAFCLSGLLHETCIPL